MKTIDYYDDDRFEFELDGAYMDEQYELKNKRNTEDEYNSIPF